MLVYKESNMTTIHSMSNETVSMQQAENEIRSVFFKTPAYAFKNAYFPKHHIGPISFYDWRPATSMFTPGSGNTIWDRLKTLYRSEFNIVYNDWQDMLLTVIVLASFVITLSMYFYTSGLNVIQMYSFKHPEDASDPEKVAQLIKANKNIDNWKLVQNAFIVITGTVTVWRLFKKSTTPVSNRVAAEGMRQNAKRDIWED